MSRKYIGIILFALQILLLGLLSVFGDPFPESFIMKLISLAGYGLIVWAFYAKKFQVHPLPTATADMKLITSGPFKYVRHPIYLGLLIISYSWMPPYLSSLTFLAIYPLFLVIIVIKIMFEEKDLYAQFPEYSEYARKTKRLIPFIY